MTNDLMRLAVNIAFEEGIVEREMTLYEFGQFISRHAETLLQDAANTLREERKRSRLLQEKGLE
jgi:hypothetical protein